MTDLAAFWMPFTNNRAFKAAPRMLASAQGMHYHTLDGKRLLDGTSGLWCVNAGHGRRQIIEAITEQAAILDFAPAFQLGHPGPFELAAKLAALMPEGLDRVFFTNSGSDSVETALKMALAYHQARGEAGRYRLIGRQRGYHGANFGGTSVGGIVANRRRFPAQVLGVDHLRDTHGLAPAFSKGVQTADVDLAAELEELVALHGAETIAAVIVEPVAGSAGVLIPPAGYLSRLREITSRNGVLLIFDEVITGFGRLGAATAAEYFGVTPDIATFAKGLTNGAVPMGAVVASREVHDAIVDSAGPGIEFAHGYTCSGHPLASAAGIATLDLYLQDDLFQRSAELSSTWEQAVHGLAGAPHVTDIRNIGLVAGIDLARRDGAAGTRAMDAFHRSFDQGLLIRVTGDTIALSPPLIISEAQIYELVERLSRVLKDLK